MECHFSPGERRDWRLLQRRWALGTLCHVGAAIPRVCGREGRTVGTGGGGRGLGENTAASLAGHSLRRVERRVVCDSGKVSEAAAACRQSLRCSALCRVGSTTAFSKTPDGFLFVYPRPLHIQRNGSVFLSGDCQTDLLPSPPGDVLPGASYWKPQPPDPCELGGIHAAPQSAVLGSQGCLHKAQPGLRS